MEHLYTTSLIANHLVAMAHTANGLFTHVQLIENIILCSKYKFKPCS